MKLSIITINRNNAEGLRRTLESTFDNQSGFDDWEQIVVDGASTDGSFTVLNNWKDNPHLGWHVSEPDKGIYNAMNKGTSHAQGDYLLFLNSGDELCRDVLKKVFAAFPRADIIYGDLLMVSTKGETHLKEFPDASDLTPAWFLFGWLPHPATFIARSCLQSFGGYDESLRIVSDAKFFTQAGQCSNVRFAHLIFPGSRFWEGGVAGKPEYRQMRRLERENGWNSV
jgi:glycosyltransferase involved in cell wall biosynthesis